MAAILPVMVVTTLATLVGRAFSAESLDTLQLSRRGIALHRREDVIMRSHAVGSIMRPAMASVNDRLPIDGVMRHLLDHDAISAYVVDSENRFFGTIAIHDIMDPERRALGGARSGARAGTNTAAAPALTAATSMPIPYGPARAAI